MKNRVNSNGQFRFTWPFQPQVKVLAVKGSKFTIRIYYGPTRKKTFELDVVYFGLEKDLVAGIQNGSLCNRAWDEASLPKPSPVLDAETEFASGRTVSSSESAYPRYLTNMCE